jgi:hypothetical protein
MKALSFKQPWAELVLQGKKKIEIRRWNTNFRGEFLIHASKSPDMDAMKRFGFILTQKKTISSTNQNMQHTSHWQRQDTTYNKRFGFKISELPLGCIVGKAKLIEVKHYKNPQEFEQDKLFHLATIEFGDYGFILKDTERLKPVKCKGNLNFWDFKD